MSKVDYSIDKFNKDEAFDERENETSINMQVCESKDVWLSKEKTKCLKGILAICVLACHLRGRMLFLNDTIIGSILTALGYLSVSVFFFLSGYGVTISYKKKGYDYIKTFPKKRLLSFYVVYLTALIIYLVYKLVVIGTSAFNWLLVIKSLTFGGTFVNNGWYLQAILIFYIIFYFSFKFLKNDKVRVFVVAALLAIYSICCLIFKNLGEIWCECSFSFLFGICWALYEEKNKMFFDKNKNYWISIVLIFFVAVATILYGAKQGIAGYIRIPIRMISAVAFAFLVILIMKKFPINFFITKFLGHYSMEIYIIHGLFISLFCDVFAITNAWVFISLVCVCTIVSAIILNPFFDCLSKLVKGERSGNKS